MLVYMIVRTQATGESPNAFTEWINSTNRPCKTFKDHYRDSMAGKVDESYGHWVYSEGGFGHISLQVPNKDRELVEAALTGELSQYIYLFYAPPVDPRDPPRIIEGPNYATIKAAGENPAGVNCWLAHTPAIFPPDSKQYQDFQKRSLEYDERLRREQEERNAK